MSGPFDPLDKEKKKRLRRKAQPAFINPMLARLSHEPFSDPRWIFERKFDGERCLTFRRGRKVTLKSRNNQNLSSIYPEIREAVEKGPEDGWIVDGEIVAFRGKVTSFERLQNRMKVRDQEAVRRLSEEIPVYYYVFDLLYLGGYDITSLDLRKRKNLLKKTFDWKDPIRFTPHRNGNGKEYFQKACRKRWEGIIAKKADSSYVHHRSSNWLKFKCVGRQEFVIGGFTDPKGERIGFGALLIGYFEKGVLRYAGKVGTGFTRETLKDLADGMKEMEVENAPFEGEGLPQKGVHWIKPEMVGEFAFTELTKENKLRHPRFLGLRHDKSPKDVVLEKERQDPDGQGRSREEDH